MRQFAEKQHTQINCITFGSLQFSHASLIWQIPLLPAHANFWSAYFDHCDNVYFHSIFPLARPLSFRTSQSRNRDVKKM